jgi:hypothetical protein
MSDGVIDVEEAEVVTTDASTELAEVEYRETELIVPLGYTFEQWSDLGSTLARLGQGVMFWIGDWWLAGEHRWGESAAQAAPTGFSVKTLQNAAFVASAVPPHRRRDNVSFSHHSAVAALPPLAADGLLVKAADEQLPVSKLRELVREVKGTQRTPRAKPLGPDTLEKLYELIQRMTANGAVTWAEELAEVLDNR